MIRFFAMSSATPRQGVNPCEHHQQQVPGPVHVQVQPPWEQQQQELKETNIKRTDLHYYITSSTTNFNNYIWLFMLYQYWHFYDFLPQPCEPHLSNNEAGLGNPPGHSAKVSGQHSGTQCCKIAMCSRKWTQRKQIWSIETYYAAPNG